MNKHKTVFFIAHLLFLVFSSGLSGQETGSPGYIVTNGHDTLDVSIISFGKDFCRYDDGDKIYEKRPGEIYGFRIRDGKFFVTKTVPVNGFDQTIFVEYLLNGIVSIYSVKQMGLEYYFAEKEGLIYDLTNENFEVIVDGTVRTGQTNRFKGVLITLLSDTPELIPAIETASLSRRSMVDISKKYHQIVCTEYECIEYEREFNNVVVKIGPAITTGFSSYRFREIPRSASLSYISRHQGTSQFNTGIGFSMLIDIGSKGMNSFFNITTLVLREDYYSTAIEDIITDERLYELTSKPLIISPNITFNIGPVDKKLNPFIGGGYGFDVYFDRNSTAYNYYDVNDDGLQLLFSSVPRFMSSVHSAIFTTGIMPATGPRSVINIALSLKLNLGFSKGILFMPGWGAALTTRYYF